MQGEPLKQELDAVMATLRSGHEILPCMQRWLPAGEATTSFMPPLRGKPGGLPHNALRICQPFSERSCDTART